MNNIALSFSFHIYATSLRSSENPKMSATEQNSSFDMCCSE